MSEQMRHRAVVCECGKVLSVASVYSEGREDECAAMMAAAIIDAAHAEENQRNAMMKGREMGGTTLGSALMEYTTRVNRLVAEVHKYRATHRNGVELDAALVALESRRKDS